MNSIAQPSPTTQPLASTSYDAPSPSAYGVSPRPQPGPAVTASINPFTAAKTGNADLSSGSSTPSGNSTGDAPVDNGLPPDPPQVHVGSIAPTAANALDPEEFDPRDDALNAMKDQITSKMPSYHAASTQYMKQFIQSNFGIDIDPDATYLNQYEAITRDRPNPAGSKFPPVKEQVGVGKLVRSTPLSEISYNNLYELVDSKSGRFHISTRSDPNQSAADEKDVIDPQAFFDALTDARRGLDFKDYYANKIDEFYNDPGNHEAMRNIAQTEANLGIDKQYALGLLDEDSYALAKRAFNPDPNDKDPPKVYPLEIAGYQSNDGLVIVGKDRTLNYLRGEKTPITSYKSPEDWQKKFVDAKHFNEATQNALTFFAVKHFSQNDAGGRSDAYGVMAALGSGTETYWGQAGHWLRNVRSNPFSQDKEMHRDPFGGLLAINQRHDKEDAQFDITSRTDINNKKFYRLVNYMPLPPLAPGALKGLFAKTKSEKSDAVYSAAFDVVTLGASRVAHPVGRAIGKAIGGTRGGTIGGAIGGLGSHGLANGYPIYTMIKAPATPVDDPGHADNALDPDDPSNRNNFEPRWQWFPTNNFNRSYEMTQGNADTSARQIQLSLDGEPQPQNKPVNRPA